MIQSALAQATTGATESTNYLMIFLQIGLVIGVFYFFLIRPQQKKQSQQKNLLSSLRRGDRVITSGGIIGLITKVLNDQEVQVEIAEGVRVRVARAMVVDVISKTEPFTDSQEDVKDSEPKRSATKSNASKASSRSKKSSQ